MYASMGAIVPKAQQVPYWPYWVWFLTEVIQPSFTLLKDLGRSLFSPRVACLPEPSFRP